MMAAFFKPKLEILPLAQRTLWTSLLPSKEAGMVLYGGTAIALRLGHRESIDFDFFTDQPLNKIDLGRQFDFIAGSRVLQDQPNTLTISVYKNVAEPPVKVSFFGGLGFGRVDNPEETDDHILLAASLEDLMGHKLKVLLQRVEAKDYKDIAAMVESGVSLGTGLSAARSLFGRNFQPSESLKALVYFEGGDLHLLTDQEKSILVDASKTVRDLTPVEIISQSLTIDEFSATRHKAEVNTLTARLQDCFNHLVLVNNPTVDADTQHKAMQLTSHWPALNLVMLEAVASTFPDNIRIPILKAASGGNAWEAAWDLHQIDSNLTNSEDDKLLSYSLKTSIDLIEESGTIEKLIEAEIPDHYRHLCLEIINRHNDLIKEEPVNQPVESVSQLPQAQPQPQPRQQEASVQLPPDDASDPPRRGPCM